MDILKTLREVSSSEATSFITIVAPYSRDATSKLRTFLKKEMASAENIRNRLNRHSVASALSKISEYVSEMKEMPPTGIAFYAGQYI